MARVVTDDKHYRDIADVIRRSNVTADTYKPSELASQITTEFARNYSMGYEMGSDETYEEAYQEGFVDGENEGIEQGKQAEQNRISDIVQQNGARTDFNYGFAGLSWTDETFALVKGDIVPNGFSVTTNMFSKCGITDLRSSTTGKNIDLTHCSNLNYALAELVNTKYLGTVDVSKATYGQYVFNQSSGLMLIEKLILPTTKPGYVFGTTCFSNCTSLTEITEIEGYLFGNVSFQWCPLNRLTLTNIANALHPTATATLTVKKTAVDEAFPNRAEWDALFINKPNWTVSEV